MCPVTRTLPILSFAKGKRALPILATRRLYDIVGTRFVSKQSDSWNPIPSANVNMTKTANHALPRASSLPIDALSPYHPQRYFDKQYREQVMLTDGTLAIIRLVRPSDHDLWIDGFSRLSHTSRYMRFCTAKKRLSEREIRYFTVLDQESHFAIVAVREDTSSGGGGEVGLGVARFIRSNDDPTRAEPAITVTDDAQSHGLGTLLALRLAAAAKERGVEYFDASVLGSNNRVIRLIKDVAPDSAFRRYGSDTVISTKLPDIDPQESWLHLHEQQQQDDHEEEAQSEIGADIIENYMYATPS